MASLELCGRWIARSVVATPGVMEHLEGLVALAVIAEATPGGPLDRVASSIR